MLTIHKLLSTFFFQKNQFCRWELTAQSSANFTAEIWKLPLPNGNAESELCPDLTQVNGSTSFTCTHPHSLTHAAINSLCRLFPDWERESDGVIERRRNPPWVERGLVISPVVGPSLSFSPSSCCAGSWFQVSRLICTPWPFVVWQPSLWYQNLRQNAHQVNSRHSMSPADSKRLSKADEIYFTFPPEEREIGFRFGSF